MMHGQQNIKFKIIFYLASCCSSFYQFCILQVNLQLQASCPSIQVIPGNVNDTDMSIIRI